ncbi:MAG: quinone-dependent dihydroorotate dehydrogenase [Rhodospirillales bacterium]|nr:quinone-dependent dihydroorotate dehydrogenase [Alphaproteobacteria bacterium]MBL6948268.1 quinone-dependent dihydroorotate dehydrogenase [Rhodospirillales bacterium]
MSGLYSLLWPFVRRLDPETAHGLAVAALKRGLVPACRPVDTPRLAQSLWGMDFANPVGLAAGFDKNAEVSEAMLGQGFGFVEVGTVTPKPQPGNPKPRLFRLEAERAVINRMGFNGDGMDAVLGNLPPHARRSGPVGVNLGKNKTSEDAAADYAAGVRAFAGVADYLVVNVSSPNTPGLRALQGRGELGELLDAVFAARMEAAPDAPPPVLLKVAPDLTEDDKRDIAAVALDKRLDGLIATNTTIERPEGLRDRHRDEAGGLSGKPLFESSTRVLADLYRLTEGKIPLIGVGGISSGADAYAKIRAGASLVQLYTALVYEGPGLVGRINRDLVRLMERDGFAHVSDAVGADHRE